MNFITYVLKLLRQAFVTYTERVPLLGSRILTYLLRRPELQPEVQRLSAAQRCNEDVLSGIFAQLPCGSLADAARVCQNWLHPAHRRLYYELYFDTGEASTPALAVVLRNQPVLRSLIRRLILSIPPHFCDDAHRSLVDWVQLLPEHSLQSVETGYMVFSPDDPISILDFPAICTVQFLSIRHSSFVTPDRLYKVLDMQFLEGLSIQVANSTWRKTSFRTIKSFPRLRRLSLWSNNYSMLIEELLLSLPAPLERFDFYSHNLGETELSSLRKGLTKHTPHLQHVSFWGSSFSKLCFLDDYVSRLSSLQTLVCGWPTYSPRIISQLPSTVSSLTLCTPNHSSIQFPSDGLAEALQENHNRLSRLKAVTIAVAHWSGWKERSKSLEEACMKEGICFETVVEECLLSIWFNNSIK